MRLAGLRSLTQGGINQSLLTVLKESTVSSMIDDPWDHPITGIIMLLWGYDRHDPLDGPSRSASPLYRPRTLRQPFSSASHSKAVGWRFLTVYLTALSTL